MRSLPLQCGTIRIASITGERRRIRVSGLAKARLLWLFRDFSMLDFPVLNTKQKQLIAQLWTAGSSAGSADTSPNLGSVDLIGTVDGFPPQLYPPDPPSVSTGEFRAGNQVMAFSSPPLYPPDPPSVSTGEFRVGNQVMAVSSPPLYPPDPPSVSTGEFRVGNQVMA